MIEKTIRDVLIADSALKAYLETYNHEPAVFSDFAPEDAAKPYITFYLERNDSTNNVIQEMTLYVDYWDIDKSRVSARKASERIEFLLDFKIFKNTDARYNSIRLWFSSGGWMPENDQRAVRYNQTFYVKAGRKKWCEQIH